MMTRLFSPYQLNPLELQSAARRARASRSISSGCARSAVKLFLSRHQRAHLQGQGLRNDEITRRRRARLGLPAVPVPGGRDRRRGLLGRRLHGQPGDLPADLRLRVDRRHHRPHQSDRARRGAAHRARDPEPHQRDQLQLLADARDAGDRLRHQADRGRHAQATTR